EAPPADAEAVFGARLLGIARDAVAAGVDPESALRSAARRLRSDLMNAEGEGR
ncbi:MAG: hypothetical protein JWN61_2912, partial [Pseudonocardiales bacterium]|nr:hypothetical protein [Pseudonocardiales bacterium]